MTIPGKTIDFVIIGTAKAGTTSLASWLGSHPDVCMSSPKETMFFGSPRLFDQGLDYFHSHFFPHYNGEALIGDATPAYSDWDRHPGSPKRVFNVNRNAKIIYIVRHPFKKVESSWQMYVNLSPDLVRTGKHRLYCQKAREGFAAFVSDSSLFDDFVGVCSYQYQLTFWAEQFPSENIHVMFLEDLVSHRDHELSCLSDFLDISVQPLFDADLKAENTLNQRRKPRWFMPYLRKLRFQKLLPESVKMGLDKSGFFSVPQSSLLKPIWPEEVLVRFAEAVQTDIQQFLKAHGKNEDFYSFQQAQV